MSDDTGPDHPVPVTLCPYLPYGGGTVPRNQEGRADQGPVRVGSEVGLKSTTTTLIEVSPKLGKSLLKVVHTEDILFRV